MAVGKKNVQEKRKEIEKLEKKLEKQGFYLMDRLEPLNISKLKEVFGNISKADFGKLIGVTRQYAGKILKGESVPSIEAVLKMSAVSGIDTGEFYQLKEDAWVIPYTDVSTNKSVYVNLVDGSNLTYDEYKKISNRYYDLKSEKYVDDSMEKEPDVIKAYVKLGVKQRVEKDDESDVYVNLVNGRNVSYDVYKEKEDRYYDLQKEKYVDESMKEDPNVINVYAKLGI